MAEAARAVRSPPAPRDESPGTRRWIARAFSLVEDVVYIGLGVLLAASALVMLVLGGIDFLRYLAGGSLATNVVALLDRILLVLMIVEILYTVQVSFRAHTLIPEPFLLVALIAAVRRLLVLTAEFSDLVGKGEPALRTAVVELALLIAMIVALVASLLMLRRRGAADAAERA
jgi:hypothetical protein